jgi:hypothetical protein
LNKVVDAVSDLRLSGDTNHSHGSIERRDVPAALRDRSSKSRLWQTGPSYNLVGGMAVWDSAQLRPELRPNHEIS